MVQMISDSFTHLGNPSCVKSSSDLEAQLLVALREREKLLTLALDASRECAETYNKSIKKAECGGEDEGVAMGSCVPSSSAIGSDSASDLIQNVLTLFENWKTQFLGDAWAKESDAAMRDLKANLTADNAVDALLGLSEHETQEQIATERVFRMLVLPAIMF